MYRPLRILAVIVFFISAVPLHAQLQFDVLSTDGTFYPEIRVVFEAKDGAGNSIIDFQTSDFTVVENGIIRPVTSVSCPPPITPPVSLTFVFDISFSMSLDNRLQNLKDASTQLVQELSYPPAASAVTTFDDSSAILTPYTSNRASILSAISSLAPTGGGTDFYGAFTDAVTGAIDVTKGRAGDKYIIFMTDAFQNLTAALETQIINAARAADIKVYSVTVSPNTVNMSLRRIALQTGGRWFEDVLTAQDAQGIFDQIGDEIFIYPPCTLTYETDGCDLERSLSVTLRKIGRSVTRNTTVTVNWNSIVALDVITPVVDFGQVTGTKTMNAVISGRGAPYEVTSITSPVSTFRILDYGGTAPPFTLSPGQSRTIRIQFRPVNTDRIEARLNIVCSAPCVESVIMVGGVHDPTPMKLIEPNGGEKLFSGSTFRWSWSGVTASQAAEVEYSTNSGSTWSSVTDNAYNSFYNWRIPVTPSEECLGLAMTKEERIASLDDVWTGEQPAAVMDIAVAPSGILTAAALANGHVKLFYPKDAAFVTILEAHSGSAKSADFSPNMPWLATGGSDGYVRIWDLRDGTMIQEMAGNGNVHTVRFSADGSYLVAGSNQYVALWKTWNWVRAWRHNGDTHADGTVDIAPGNKWIASGNGNTISILNFSDGGRNRSLSGHSNFIRSLDVADDGMTIVSGSDDRTVRLWNTITWQQIRAMSGHGGGVNSVSASNAMGRIISASDDDDIRIWDGRDGSLLHTLKGHTANVNGAAFDRKTKLIVSGGSDRKIRVWGYVPPLADKSDSLWTIIATVTDLQGDAPLFDPLTCPDTWSDGDAVFVNTGNQNITVSSARIAGTDAAAFEFRSGFSIPPDVLLMPEDTLRVPLRFFPARTGDFDALIEVDTDVPGNPTISLPISGHKDTVETRVLPDTLNAGELYTCSLPAQLQFIMSNEGTVNAVIDSVDTDLGESVSFPSVFPRILLPGQSDTVTVLVHPTAFGNMQGFVRMRTTPCDFEEDLFITADLVPTAIVAEPNPVIFDFAAVGDTSFTQVVLRNPTVTNMVLDSLAFLISIPPFAVLDSSAWLDSLALPDTLAPGDSITLRLAYFPQSEGDAQGALYFHTSAPCDDSLVVPLIATSSKKPSIAYSSEQFANLLCADEQTSSATATLRNTGGLPLNISALQFEGLHPGDYQILSPTAPLIIDPGENETVIMEFNYQAVGSLREATLVVLSDAENEPRVEIPFSARKDSAFFDIDPPAIGLGEHYSCEFPLEIEYRFRNQGTVDLDITVDTTLIGAGYRFVGAQWPTRVAAGESETVALELTPQAYGNYILNFTAGSDLCDISAQASASYSLAPHTADVSATSLDFGVLGFGANGTVSVSVSNPQGSPMRVRLQLPVHPDITLQSPAATDTVLQPGEDIDIILRLDAATAGDIADLLRIFTTQVCDDSVDIPITGRIDAAVAAVSVPDLEAWIGERITIPVRLDNASNLDITGTRSFTADLVFNRSMLWPEEITSESGNATYTTVTEGDNLRVRITVDQTASPAPGAMAELTCLVLLGNDDTTPLTLQEFEWSEGTASTTTSSGSFLTHGICDAGGQRLIALPSTMTLFQNVPNPFNPTTEISFYLPEESDIDLRVYDAVGREVAVLARGKYSDGTHHVTLDASGFVSGSYFAVLRSGSEIRMKRMIMMK